MSKVFRVMFPIQDALTITRHHNCMRPTVSISNY
uniref:Uncharacterized protein n=2 Tax=Anguilla anguilla TaxID=7936 RepID=A0A0E9RTR7_ANGAN